MKFKRYTKSASLSEIGQSMQTKFAIISKIDGGFEQRTPLVKCRDFLCDCYSSIIQQKDFSIYGMSWKGSTDQLDWDGVYLLLKFPDSTAKSNFYSNLSRLHDIEDTNKVPNTIVIDSSTASDLSDLEVIIQADKIWLQNVLSFSLYTLLLRIFCYQLKGEDWITYFAKQSYSDSAYIASWPRKSLDAVLGDLTLLATTEWNGLWYSQHGTTSVHHNSGIVSCFSRHSEQNDATVRKNKHWQEMNAKGLETCVK